MEFIYEKFSPSFARWVRIGHLLIQIALVAVIAYQGWNYAQFGWRSFSPTTRIPRFYPYLSVFVGAALMLIYSVFLLVKHIYEEFINTKSAVSPEAADEPVGG